MHSNLKADTDRRRLHANARDSLKNAKQSRRGVAHHYTLLEQMALSVGEEEEAGKAARRRASKDVSK